MNKFLNFDQLGSDVITDSFSEGNYDLFLPGDTPMYFGAQRELYGVCRIPEKIHHSVGVLFCYPLGEEYIENHRFLAEISDWLLKRGLAAFKFDYLGTGDSLGDMDDWNMEVWTDNLVTAADELKHRTGVERLRVVAVGLGGILAAKAIGKGLKVEKLVLWDPVVSGRRYLDELRELHKKRIARQKKLYPFPKDRDLLLQQDEINGFCLLPKFQATIAACDLDALSNGIPVEIDTIVSPVIKGYQSVFAQVQQKRRINKAITSSVFEGVA